MLRKGWRKEPARHSLAARGIETRKGRDVIAWPQTTTGLREFDVKYTYPEGTVKITSGYSSRTHRAVLFRIDAIPEKAGLGRRAMLDFEESMKDLGAKVIVLSAWPESKEFYEKLGYHLERYIAEFGLYRYSKELK
jgi:hypothetical protein